MYMLAVQQMVYSARTAAVCRDGFDVMETDLLKYSGPEYVRLRGSRSRV
jgi:hypothetical protein